MDNPLTLNRYTYTHNNPLRYWDPSGHVAAEGAGSFFGGSYEELMLHWSDVAVAYADANGMDFIDAVDFVVPVEHRAEVKTIVGFNGGAKAYYQAGDLPGVGSGTAGAAATAGTIKNIKNALKSNIKNTNNIAKGKGELPTPKYVPKDSSGNPLPLPRTDGKMINGTVHVPEPMNPHTQIGWQNGRKGDYIQTLEWGENGAPVKRTDWTDHGRPQNHTNPHDHPAVFKDGSWSFK